MTSSHVCFLFECLEPGGGQAQYKLDIVVSVGRKLFSVPGLDRNAGLGQQ